MFGQWSQQLSKLTILRIAYSRLLILFAIFVSSLIKIYTFAQHISYF